MHHLGDTEYEAASRLIRSAGISHSVPGSRRAKRLAARNWRLILKIWRRAWDWASCLASEGKYPEALEEFLAMIAKDKNFRDEIARRSMLAIFSLVGERSDLADEYRHRLARTLY
jgi:hypothetical protein